ncbi:hypothetical protein HDU76_002586 [Blyttiomyces sp. JEL0837]|nr:hypothetical protein HDU76_002586 [Blyttiomyces sp. JEL0837]
MPTVVDSLQKFLGTTAASVLVNSLRSRRPVIMSSNMHDDQTTTSSDILTTEETLDLAYMASPDESTTASEATTISKDTDGVPVPPKIVYDARSFHQEAYDEMSQDLNKITNWRGSASLEKEECFCIKKDKKIYSPSAVHKCLRHTPDQDPSRTFDRVRMQEVWQIKMVYEQPLLAFSTKDYRFEVVYVLNGFRTHSNVKFIAISHLWPKPYDKAQEHGDIILKEQPHKVNDKEPKHAREIYKYNKVSITKGGATDWAKEKIDRATKLARQQYPNEEVLIWLDIVSVDQSNFFSVRDATYAMSIAYHIADMTIVMLDEDDNDGARWLSRRWTLQELELAHSIILIRSDGEEAKNLPAVAKAREMMGKHKLYSALCESSKRESRYPHDLVYSVRGLVPALFELPVVYDIDVYTLLLRAATVCAQQGDYSMLGCERSGLPAGCMLRRFWLKDDVDSSKTKNSCNVAPLASLTGCGLMFEQQNAAMLTKEDLEEFRKAREKKIALFSKEGNDDGQVARKSMNAFQEFVRNDYGATNISIKGRNALDALGKAVNDIYEFEHCESFDLNFEAVRDEVLNKLTNTDEALACLKIMKDALVHADPKHPLAVPHKRTQNLTWVLKSDVTAYEFCKKGIAFVKKLLETRPEFPTNAHVLIMRDGMSDECIRLRSITTDVDPKRWLIVTQSMGVSYADQAAIVEYTTTEKRIRTQRGVALVLHAESSLDILDSSKAFTTDLFDTFGVGTKLVLETLVHRGAGQKAPVVLGSR